MTGRILVTVNLIATVCLLFYVVTLKKKLEVLNLQSKTGYSSNVVRASRFEVTGNDGRTTAIFGHRSKDELSPVLVLFDNNGRRVIETAIDEKGNSTLYFSNRRIDGKVAVGYLWGSESPIPKGEDDPLASYGIRILSRNGGQLKFGLDMNDRPISH